MAHTKPIESVALVGLGALGCAYLGKMAETLPMQRIQVIAEGERAERYKKNGVVLNKKRLNFPIVSGKEARFADLLIFTVKFNQLAEAVRLARGAVGPDTIVISLLNGVTSEEIIAASYGWDKVLYSLSIAIDATRKGDETSLTSYGVIPFGEATNTPGSYSANVSRLKEFFARVGLRHEVPEDMKLALWRKFLLNVGVNQISAVLGTGYGALQRPGTAREIAVSAMREVLDIAGREGVALSEKDIETGLSVLTNLSPEGKCSMVQDMEAHRKTEVAIFGGTVLALAKKHGLQAPVNDMLVRIIRAKEELFENLF